MQIIHKIDDFLFTLFPEVDKSNNESVIAMLEKYYSYGPFKPKVTIDDGIVVIDIDTELIKDQDNDYDKAIKLCDKGKYSEAKPILNKLIERNPTNSEFYRIYGQILSDEGDQEEAINYLIDALKWDSKNAYALLMMGNIFAKFKDDIPTAMKYYDQALKVKPNDNITINNIGANLMHQGKLEEAKKYFWKAVEIDPKYPQTHFALGMVAEMENDLESSFHSTIEAIKLNTNKKGALYNNCIKQAFEVAKRISKEKKADKIVKNYLHKLEFDVDKEIKLIEDADIPTAAKFEFAENHDRDEHIIRYKPNYPAVQHLILHELVHLELAIAARKEKKNLIFLSTQENKAKFIKKLGYMVKKYEKMGYDETSISSFLNGLFDGLNNQAYNTPIDLFIENIIYNEYKELRPYQFLSLYVLIQEGIKAVTDVKSFDVIPKEIISKSKIYNLVNAIQYRHLYGINFFSDFNPTDSEGKQSVKFYNEYLKRKDDKTPGEEYQLVLNWAEELNLDKNFELINEIEFRNKRANISNILKEIEKDPFDSESEENINKKRDTEKFLESQKAIGTNMAVVMYMRDAMSYFKDIPKDDIKNIAFEIAIQGTQGYRPDKEDYRLSLIPNKVFTGYHILAYYYVSWMLAMPEMVPELKLPYENEYNLALELNKPNK